MLDARFYPDFPVDEILHEEIGQHRWHYFDSLFCQPFDDVFLGKRIEFQENFSYDSDLWAVFFLTDFVEPAGCLRQASQKFLCPELSDQCFAFLQVIVAEAGCLSGLFFAYGCGVVEFRNTVTIQNGT